MYMSAQYDMFSNKVAKILCIQTKYTYKYSVYNPVHNLVNIKYCVYIYANQCFQTILLH